MRSSCSQSTALARFASVLFALALFSPGPISAALGDGWPRYSRPCRPKSWAGLPACWHWRDRICQRRNRFGASWSGGSSHSTRSSTRRKENPLNSATIRRCCRQRWMVCSPPGRLAHGGGTARPAAERPGSAGGRCHLAKRSAGTASGGARRASRLDGRPSPPASGL